MKLMLTNAWRPQAYAITAFARTSWEPTSATAGQDFRETTAVWNSTNACQCPAQNNATCLNEINRYECVCEPGFTGVNCEIEINECEVMPCLNGATCIDLIAAFSCACVPGFTDSVCSTNIDECEPVPCLNGGQCRDGINSYTCNCSDTGFKGDNCDINIDDCEIEPCQHEGNCTDLVKDYLCTCHDGYDGKQ